MTVKLTIVQQRKIAQSLTPAQMKKIKSICGKCEQKGEGFSDIFKKVQKFLGSPLAKAIGKTVLKEIILPFLKKAVKKKLTGGGCKGKGLKLAGGGLKLAGGRAKKKKPKRPKMPKPKKPKIGPR